MRQAEGPDHHEWVRRMRALARQDAEEMVPRPDFPVLGLCDPPLEPAALAEFRQVNGSWTAVTLGYGAWEAAGPYVAVMSAATDESLAAVTAGLPGHGPEAELLRAIDAERNRVAVNAGVDDEEPAQPPLYSREALPAGSAMICRHGPVWAARLLSATGVTVTITGRGVDPAAVRLEPVSDLRPLFEARSQILGRLAERRRREPPVLEPAEGVAAFRALAEFTLAGHARIRAAVRAGRLVRQPANWGAMHGALWQRAVREQQRIAGVNKPAAEDAVTSVINHLGHLDDEAAWFTTDVRLREAAIDETLRHAVLGDEVASLPAQRAWALYWARHTTGRRPAEPAEPADPGGHRSLSDGWLTAWTAWTASA